MARRKPKYQREKPKPDEANPPVHRIPADIAEQAPHTSWGGVPLFYEDKTFVCIDCGCQEVWTAEQQKWWYETAKGSIHTTAIRCVACRQRIRETHAGTPRRTHEDRRQELGPGPEDS